MHYFMTYNTIQHACINNIIYIYIYIYIIYIYIYDKHLYICTPCLGKSCAKLFLSELRQTSINFQNFGSVDDKMAEVIRYKYIFHLTLLVSSHYSLLNTKVVPTKFYSFSGKTVKIYSFRTSSYFH